MQNRFPLSVAIFGILAGCLPTTEGYQNLVDSYKGATEDQLISKWGAPHGVYSSGKKKYLTYVDQRNVFIAGTQPQYTTTLIGNTAYTNTYGGTPSQTINVQCETTFVVSGGKILGATFRGNDCVAVPSEPS